MPEGIPIFVGFDRKETLAYHVLCHSILSRSSEPVSITPLYRKNLGKHYWRPRGEHDSTDFSNSRFIVPHLMQFQGWAIFLDSDMVATADINALWSQRDDQYAVMVRRQTHDASGEGPKFLGQEQSAYNRKNWSSLMLFNCDKCRQLTRHIVNTITPGLWLHQFRWVADEEIGAIQGAWNHLVGVHEPPPQMPELLHFTRSPVWFREGEPQVYDDVWLREVADLLQGDNPLDSALWLKT